MYQPQYLLTGLGNEHHPDIARALNWIRQHIEEPFTMKTLSNAVGLSPRTLARRFQTNLGQNPLETVQHIRIQYAVHLLQSTKLTLDEIAARIGYANVSSLRRLLKTSMGKTPKQLR